MHAGRGRWMLPAVWQLVLFLVVGRAGAAGPRTLDFLGFPSASLGEPVGTGVALSPDGKHLYVTGVDIQGPGGGTLSVYRRDSVTGKLLLVETHRDDGVVDGPQNATSVAVSPDGAHVYVTGGAEASGDAAFDAVAVFARDSTTGALTFLEMERNGFGGISGIAFAEAVVLSPDGMHAYVASLDNRVAVFARNPATGHLTPVEVKQNGVGAVHDMISPIALDVSPDGAHVYVAALGASILTGGSVVGFSRNAGTGQLTFVEAEVQGTAGVDGLVGLEGVAVSPDGASVYVVGHVDSDFPDLHDSTIVVFSRNSGTGALTFVEAHHRPDVPGRPEGVTVSPDGATVYAAGTSIMVFARDPSTGSLIELESHAPSYPPQSRDAVVTSDGLYVYTTSDNGVPIFTRDPATGRLTLLEVERGFPRSGYVALSPDGAQLYVGGYDTIATLARDASSGLLTFVEGFGDVFGEQGYGLNGGSNDMVVAPDGAHAYVTGRDAVIAFSRDAGTGLLTFVEAEHDGVAGVDGLGGASRSARTARACT